MKIAIIGYGKMGKAIHALAENKGHNVVCFIDSTADWDKSCKPLGDLADVAIEFTGPETAIPNIIRCFREHIPVVCGSTGWTDNMQLVEEAQAKYDGALVWAPNFSPGVNLFFQLNEWFADIMEKFPDYDVSIEEIHHTKKLDAPSGTAVYLANQLIDKLSRIKKWVRAEEAGEDLSELPVFSERIDDVTGIHTVSYESNIDRIELRHSAKNRLGFTAGALLAASWIINKKGIFTLKDILF